MSDHKAHHIQTAMHNHGPHCGHMTIAHGGHSDYLFEGRLDHVGEHQVETHSLEVNEKNPTACTPSHLCGGHSVDHTHGLGCGHEMVPHGDHHDYLVGGHLHRPCDKHCDDHGEVRTSGPRKMVPSVESLR